MYILCCGAGTVGSHTAEVLVAAGHDVMVIDQYPDRLTAIEENLDVKTLCGNCAHADVLREAGAAGADLLVASTNVDEVNLLTASVGKAVGARKAIARVHRSTYFENRGLNYARHLGIDELICPEYSTAVAIAGKLRSPGALFIENFADNKIHMQQFPVGAQVVGKSLPELSLPRGVRLAAIVRGGTPFIPTAQTTIERGDVVAIVGNAEVFEDGRRRLAGGERSVRRLAIMGGSAIAVWLCRALEGRGFAIRLFEVNRARAEELAQRLDGVTVIAADPTDPTVFDEEHLAQADCFIALVGDDERNILACAWAKRRGVGRTAAVVQKPNYLYLLGEVGIDIAVNPRLAAAREIERLLHTGPWRLAAVLAEGSVDVFQVRVGEGSAVVGQPLRAVKVPAEVVIAAVQHGSKVFVPGAEDSIGAGDLLLVVAARAAEQKLKRFFAVG